MTRNDPVLERLRSADPSPAPSAQPDTLLSNAALRSLIDTRIDSHAHAAPQTAPESGRTPIVRPKVVVPAGSASLPRTAVLSGAVVLVLGLAFVLLNLGGAVQPPGLETSSGSSTVRVEAFIEAWNGGDHDHAMTAMAADLTVNGDAWTGTEWRSYMEYTEAIGLNLDAECTGAPEAIRCETTGRAPFIATAEGAHGVLVFGVSDDLIHEMTIPMTGAHEQALAGWAMTLDADAFGEACGPADGSRWLRRDGTVGTALNARCGAFIGAASESMLAGQAAVGTVTSFFDAWNLGDTDAAGLLLDPEVRVNGIAGLAAWNRFMEFSIQFEGFHEVTGCEATPSGPTCEWIWRTPFVDGQQAPNVGATEIRFSIVDGLIQSFQTPNYGSFETPLVEFAKTVDENSFDASCISDGIAIVGTSSAVFDATCGAHLASLVDDFLISLEG